jgi:hypothetical protein
MLMSVRILKMLVKIKKKLDVLEWESWFGSSGFWCHVVFFYVVKMLRINVSFPSLVRHSTLMMEVTCSCKTLVMTYK